MKAFQFVIWLFFSTTVFAERLFLSELDQDGIRWVIVSAEQLQPFYGIDIEMSYSADRLVLVSAADSPVSQVVPGTLLNQDAFTIVNRVDVRTGTIRYAVSVLHPASAIEGSGVLFSIPFRAKGKESGEFTIARIETGSRDGEKRTLSAPATVLVFPPESMLPKTPLVADNLTPFVESNKHDESRSMLIIGLGALLLLFILMTLFLVWRLNLMKKTNL